MSKKAIMISIKPKWVVKILNGEKTIEIRKTMPKCELPIDVYIYCTKSNYFGYISKRYAGKVVAKFTLNKVEEIKHKVHWEDFDSYYMLGNMVYDDEETCVSEEELSEYLKGNTGYAWHISNLVIFDKPKELSEFRRYTEIPHCYQDTITKKTRKTFNDNTIPFFNSLAKAPQSFMFIEVE